MGTKFENWIEAQENDQLFSVGEVNSEAQRMLEYSETNRVVTPQQATACLALRTMADDLIQESEAWSWLYEFADRVEMYQLTVGLPKNSREYFAQILTGHLQQNNEKSVKKGVL